MSDLTALQPTIFFASCTLKGIFWISFSLLPEHILKVFHHFKTTTEDDEEEEEDLSYEEVHSETLMMQDHHVLLLERICHYTNIFLLLGLIAFYAVNPRLWKYRHYGWFLTTLLVVQHVPQQLRHDGWWGTTTTTSTSTEDYEVVDDEDEPLQLIQHILRTNQIFSTIGVILIQGYCCYYGHWATLQRLAAEPFFVFGAMITLLMETHLTCLSVWLYRTTTHLSTVLPYQTRVAICGGLFGFVLLPLALWHRRVHVTQAKLLRKQLKSVRGGGATTTTPKMKFV